MAITAITITQNNWFDSSNLMAVHSPLVFLAKATYNAEIPDTLNVEVKFTSGTGSIETYTAVYFKDISSTERVFAFVADEAIRYKMDRLTDHAQSDNSIMAIPDLTKGISIAFYMGSVRAEVDIVAVAAARDFISTYGPILYDEYNNVEGSYIGTVGKQVYLYWYNKSAANVINGSTYPVGFVRKAVVPTTEGKQRYNININGTYLYHTVYAKNPCEKIIIKYVDRNGQYRFEYFNGFYKGETKPESLGDVEKFVTSLLTDTSDTRRIGYRTNDIYTLTANNVSQIELSLIRGMYNSNDVMVFINNKWVTVTLSGDFVYKLGKHKFSDVTINIKLPKSYNITLL